MDSFPTPSALHSFKKFLIFCNMDASFSTGPKPYWCKLKNFVSQFWLFLRNKIWKGALIICNFLFLGKKEPSFNKQALPCFLTPPCRRFGAQDIGGGGWEEAEGRRQRGACPPERLGDPGCEAEPYAEPGLFQDTKEFLSVSWSTVVGWTLHFTETSIHVQPRCTFLTWNSLIGRFSIFSCSPWTPGIAFSVGWLGVIRKCRHLELETKGRHRPHKPFCGQSL